MSSKQHCIADDPENRRSVVLLAMAIFLVLAIPIAWICDDAWITFRVVRNFFDGYGLRWNISERVQVYTHPLWMFAVSGFYFVTREFYLSVIVLSLTVSTVALGFLGFRIANNAVSAGFIIFALCCSKAFMDYSTSGLENPLTHLLLVLLFAAYLKKPPWASQKNLFQFSLISALIVLNRMDCLLLCLPALLLAFFKAPSRKSAGTLVLGFLPFLLWECFSLLYYGFLFPNTAYAKLGTGIPRAELLEQGLYYVLDSLKYDPVTPVILLAGLLLPLFTKQRNLLPISLGALLYLLYIVFIGGDFMSGRMFTAPLVLSAVVLSESKLFSLKTPFWLFFAIILAFVSTSALRGRDFGVSNKPYIKKSGIADERAFYYRVSGLGTKDRWRVLPRWRRRIKGERLECKEIPIVEQETAGIFGFSAGPGVHVVDPFGLGDPLLSRLPGRYNFRWRPGHLLRQIPQGYKKTITSGKNRIKDPKIARYYDSLSVVVRGDLFSTKRFWEIWRFLIGVNTLRVDEDFYRFPNRKNVEAEMVSEPKKDGTKWNAKGNVVFRYHGVLVKFPKVKKASEIEVSLDANDAYELRFMHGKKMLSRTEVQEYRCVEKGLGVRRVKVPNEALSGFDGIWIMPIRGDKTFSLGHLIAHL